MWYDDDDRNPLDNISNPVWIPQSSADPHFLAFCRACGVDLRVPSDGDESGASKIEASADDLQTLLGCYFPGHEPERF